MLRFFDFRPNSKRLDVPLRHHFLAIDGGKLTLHSLCRCTRAKVVRATPAREPLKRVREYGEYSDGFILSYR
jgi:hypothetical protein